MPNKKAKISKKKQQLKNKTSQCITAPSCGTPSIEVLTKGKCSEIQASAGSSEKSLSPRIEEPVCEPQKPPPPSTSQFLYSEVLAGIRTPCSTKVSAALPSSSTDILRDNSDAINVAPEESDADKAAKSLNCYEQFPALKGHMGESQKKLSEAVSEQTDAAQVTSKLSEITLNESSTNESNKLSNIYERFLAMKGIKADAPCEWFQPLSEQTDTAQLADKCSEHTLKGNSADNFGGSYEHFPDLKASMTEPRKKRPEITKLFKNDENDAKNHGGTFSPNLSFGPIGRPVPKTNKDNVQGCTERNPVAVENDEDKDTSEFKNPTGEDPPKCSTQNTMSIEIPLWNFTEIDMSSEGYPGFFGQYQDENYLKHEEMAMVGLQLQLNKNSNKSN